jgi:hypothetical protein
MIFHLLVLILLLAASFLLQELTPGVISLIEAATGGSEDFLHRARLLFLPAYCFTAALTVPFPLMLAIAFVGGILWDASHALIWGEGSPGFGSGPLLFGFFCAIMHGAGDFFARGRWVFPILLGGGCVFSLLLAEYLWINFRAGDFSFPAGIWIKICMSALLTTFIMPVFLLALDRSMRSHGLLGTESGFGSR